MEDARVAADHGDWAAFTTAISLGAGRDSEWTVRILKGWSDKPGKYGDPRGDIVLGVQADDARAYTHLHDWQITWNAVHQSAALH